MARTASVWPPIAAVPAVSALLALLAPPAPPAPPALSIALDALVALLVGLGPAAADAAAFDESRELGAPRITLGSAKEASHQTAPLSNPGDALSDFVWILQLTVALLLTQEGNVAIL